MTAAAGAITIVAAMALAACSPSATTAPSAEPYGLTIFAASSLTDAMAEIEAAYEQETAGVNLIIATDSSAALRTQIEEGAPADVFLSADTANPDALAAVGLTADAPIPLLGNSLALVVPTANDARIETPADLATDGVEIIAAGPEVPITGYATEVIAHLAALPDYAADFAAAYAANVISEEDNVRGVLTKIELGEADAGFVYRTDALGSTDVTIIEIPVEANVHAIYSGCVINTSEHLEPARMFVAWLSGPGQAIFAEFGFVAP